MLMHKIGDVVVNNTDNLLISSLVSTIAVGCYSNYFLIVGSVRQLMKQVFTGITASVGNLGVKEGKERIKTIFDAAFFMNQWICGMITVCIYEVLDLFVEISFGKQYVFAGYITLIICLNFYFTGMRETTLIFRNSMGVFWYDRYKSIAEAIINLVVSIWLGSQWGVAGIFLGTLISTMTTSFWIEPYMLHKHRFERSVLPYFVKYVLYTAVTFLVWLGLHKICVGIDGNPWLVCCERVLLCLTVLNLVYFACYHRTKEFALLWEKGKHLLKRLGRRAS